MYTIDSIGVWQYTIRSALLPRTYLCPMQLPMKSMNMHGEKIKTQIKCLKKYYMNCNRQTYLFYKFSSVQMTV